MSEKLYTCIAVAALALIAPAAHAADDVAALLKKADAYRTGDGATRVETNVQLYKGESLDKERKYVVYTKPGHRSLVLMKSPMEAGQKMLMLADQFWLLMPDSQRPIRITASQKLLGEASTGDIASLTWSTDYNGSIVGEGDCPTAPAGVGTHAESGKPRHCVKLDLAAAGPGVTYARIDLWLEKSNGLPVKADLYVNSGKRAKEAWYESGKLEGTTRVIGMTLLDDIQAGRKTQIRYQSIAPKEVPDEFFNPAALVRNSLQGW